MLQYLFVHKVGMVKKIIDNKLRKSTFVTLLLPRLLLSSFNRDTPLALHSNRVSINFICSGSDTIQNNTGPVKILEAPVHLGSLLESKTSGISASESDSIWIARKDSTTVSVCLLIWHPANLWHDNIIRYPVRRTKNLLL